MVSRLSEDNEKKDNSDEVNQGSSSPLKVNVNMFESDEDVLTGDMQTRATQDD